MFTVSQKASAPLEFGTASDGTRPIQSCNGHETRWHVHSPSISGETFQEISTKVGRPKYWGRLPRTGKRHSLQYDTCAMKASIRFCGARGGRYEYFIHLTGKYTSYTQKPFKSPELISDDCNMSSSSLEMFWNACDP